MVSPSTSEQLIEAGSGSNIAPTAKNQTLSVLERNDQNDSVISFNLNNGTVDGDMFFGEFFDDNRQAGAYKFTWSNLAGTYDFNYGTITVVGGGQFNYTPAEFAFGNDTFMFQVTDQYGKSSNAGYITLVIQEANQAPTAACLRPSFLGVEGYGTLAAPTVLSTGAADIDEPALFDGTASVDYAQFWWPRATNNVLGLNGQAELADVLTQPNGPGALELYKALLRTNVLLPNPSATADINAGGSYYTQMGDPFVACANATTLPVPMTPVGADGVSAAPGTRGVIFALYGYDVDETAALTYHIENVPLPGTEGQLFYLDPSIVREYLESRIGAMSANIGGGLLTSPLSGTVDLQDLRQIVNNVDIKRFVPIVVPSDVRMDSGSVGTWNATAIVTYATQFATYSSKRESCMLFCFFYAHNDHG